MFSLRPCGKGSGYADRVWLSPTCATLMLAAFLDSVKQGISAGLDLPLTGEH